MSSPKATSSPCCARSTSLARTSAVSLGARMVRALQTLEMVRLPDRFTPGGLDILGTWTRTDRPPPSRATSPKQPARPDRRWSRAFGGSRPLSGGEVELDILPAMNDLQVGRVIRAVRRRRGLRQDDVAG